MRQVFVDTNVLVYLFDLSEPVKRARAVELLSGTDREVVVSTQVLLETYSALTRKLRPPMSHDSVVAVLGQLSQETVVAATADLVLSAARTSGRYQVSIWDAMIIEAAVLAGCDELWTEDLTDGQVIRGVRVVDPFGQGDSG
jgi:predicted nucleic acid-binding protein